MKASPAQCTVTHSAFTSAVAYGHPGELHVGVRTVTLVLHGVTRDTIFFDFFVYSFFGSLRFAESSQLLDNLIFSRRDIYQS